MINAPTEILTVDPARPEPSAIEQAAVIIRGGGLVAFPTETVYGLGADAMNDQAVRRIFAAKGRPVDNPLIVHISQLWMLDLVAQNVAPVALLLAGRFWPGPLTLVLNRRPDVPLSTSAGLGTIAVRMPLGKIALELIDRSGTPIAAPSANASGRPSPTRADHVLQDLGGRIEMILDGGPTSIGIESTVLDVTLDPPVILRPGWTTEASLAEVIGPVKRAGSAQELGRSPGTRHRHYTPKAKVILLEESKPEFVRGFCERLLENGSVGFVGSVQVPLDRIGFHQIILERSAEAYGRSIYDALRKLDDARSEVIVVEGLAGDGEAEAVMDRLRRAASEIIKGK
jgi:L-threonylcarbamoyladenylate synthase